MSWNKEFLYPVIIDAFAKLHGIENENVLRKLKEIFDEYIEEDVEGSQDVFNINDLADYIDYYFNTDYACSDSMKLIDDYVKTELHFDEDQVLFCLYGIDILKTAPFSHRNFIRFCAIETGKTIEQVDADYIEMLKVHGPHLKYGGQYGTTAHHSLWDNCNDYHIDAIMYYNLGEVGATQEITHRIL